MRILPIPDALPLSVYTCHPVVGERDIQRYESYSLLLLLMGWLTALVTGDLNDFILRALDIRRAEPMVEVLQGGNIFARKMHPGTMFPVKSHFMQLAVKQRHMLSICYSSLNQRI